MPSLTIRPDDLSNPQTIALLQAHRASMFEESPPESVHALDLDALRQPDIRLWSAWQGDRLAGCGALKQLERAAGEVKSMRTAAGHLRQGVAARLLEHIIAVACERGYAKLYLETGTTPAFLPAQALYRRYGFVECGPFAAYVLDPFSVFMCKELTSTAGAA